MKTIDLPKIKVNRKKEKPERKVSLIGLRTNTPTVIRAVALIALVATVIVIVYAFLRPKQPDFRMISNLPQLSDQVVAEVNGYERRETEGDVMKYLVKADKATTFSDNHQELENAFIQVYDDKGEKFDNITSKKALYIPNANDSKLFEAHFVGDVNINTRDNLHVKTEALSYDRTSEIAKTDQPVEFNRDNVNGKSVGAIVKTKEKQIELLKDVEVNAQADPNVANDEVTKAKLQSAKMTSGKAIVFQNDGRIELEQNVNINMIPLNNNAEMSQPTDMKGDKAIATFVEKEIKSFDLIGNTEVYAKPTANNPKYTKTRADRTLATIDKELKRADLTGNVYIETTANTVQPSKINSQTAVYFKPEDKFELHTGVQIITTQDNKPTVITSSDAIYDQLNGGMDLTGGAQIVQGGDIIKGDKITARLYPNKKIQNANSVGNAYLKQATADRVTEVHSKELNAQFNAEQQIERANAVTNADVSIVPVQQQEYTKVTMAAPNSIQLVFTPKPNESVLSQMFTDGRTTINMSAPPNNPKATNKRLVADVVKTYLNGNGRDLTRTEAIGNAEMYIDPIKVAPDNYQTTLTAPRFDCDFYETGNNPRVCIGQTKAKAVMTPTVPAADRGVRTILGDTLTSTFNQATQDAERLDAVGNAKFSELDRNGIADQFAYTASDQTVRLRGGEPTVWDSRARAKAVEIDWDTKNQKSFLRNKVSTTYYSQAKTNGATPFGKTSSPVNVTAENAQFDHVREIGIYTGNARAWQDENYVRANELVINQKEQRMDGEGKVQSVLYNAQRKENGKTTTVPASATSDKIAYTAGNKQLHYEGNVDMRQGTDRITANTSDIFMNEQNDVKQTNAEGNVVITQPNRRVRGTWVQYTTADEIAIVRGDPAVVEDALQGTSQGAQMTVLMRENKVVNQGSTKSTMGRTRSVYKVQNQ